MTRVNRFIRGAAVLTVAGILSKILGSVYTIVLQNIIGDRGMGLYQMAYPIYAALVILATAGLPVAVSKFVAERVARGDLAGARKVFRASAAAMGAVGVGCFALLFFGADEYARLVGDPEAVWAVRAVAPAMLLVPVMSVVRGYFQGFEMMEPTAASQVVEQGVRVATIVAAALWIMAVWNSPAWAAMGAAFGAVTGAAAGCAVLLWWVRRHAAWFWGRDRVARLEPGWARELLNYAVPVSLGALAVPLINNIDALTVVNALKQAGVPQGTATEMYGWLTGRAFKLMILPAALANAVAVALLPSIASSIAARDWRGANAQAELGIRLTVWLALPASVGLILLAGPVDRMLFRDEAGVRAIQITAAATVFSSLQVTVSSVLQSIGRPWAPVRHLAVGAAVKWLLNLWWVPRWGIEGAAAATVAGYAAAAVLNLWSAAWNTGIVLRLKRLFWHPLVASAGMAAAIGLVLDPVGAAAGEGRIGAAVTALTGVLLGMAVYGSLLLVVGGFSRGELEAIPRVGPALARVGVRLGWVK